MLPPGSNTRTSMHWATGELNAPNHTILLLYFFKKSWGNTPQYTSKTRLFLSIQAYLYMYIVLQLRLQFNCFFYLTRHRTKSKETMVKIIGIHKYVCKTCDCLLWQKDLCAVSPKGPRSIRPHMDLATTLSPPLETFSLTDRL